MKRFEGALLAQARREAGLTQNQLSYASGVPAQNIGRYERGDHEPFISVIADLAHALGQPLDYFLVEDISPIEAAAEEVARRALA